MVLSPRAGPAAGLLDVVIVTLLISETVLSADHGIQCRSGKGSPRGLFLKHILEPRTSVRGNGERVEEEAAEMILCKHEDPSSNLSIHFCLFVCLFFAFNSWSGYRSACNPSDVRGGDERVAEACFSQVFVKV